MSPTKLQICIYNTIKKNKLLTKISLKILCFFNFNKYKIKGLRNTIIDNGVYLKNIKFDIIGDDNHIYFFGESIIENFTIYIRGSKHNLFVGKRCVLQGGSFWFEDNNCIIKIGENTTFENAHLAVTENEKSIEIGNYCMLAYDIEIRTGDSHSIIDLGTNNRINYAQNVKICDHVWIGAGVKILKGVSIGENSIIGTGSIVTKSIPENCVAAGIPAKIIRKNVTWERKRID